MRILHFNQYGSNIGGVEGYISEVSAALTAAGHESRLVSFATEEPNRLMPRTVQIVAPSLMGTLAEIERVITDFQPDVAFLHAVQDPELVRWICEQLPAVAYVHGPYLVCPGYALFLRRSTRVCERPAGLECLISAQIESCCFGRNPFRHLQRLQQVQSLLKAISRIDVLVGSEFMRHQLIANGLPADKINILAPVLFNETVFEYAPPAEPGIILFGGRITQEKGLQHLLEALAGIRQGSWRLIVAGDGPDRPRCEKLAHRLEIAEYVDFAGWIEPKQMSALYQRCAFVIIPSLWPEPYGRIGPEAFARGRPVVAYAVGGIPDWLKDGNTGYLVTPGDIKKLRETIAQLLNNPGNLERMGRAAQEQARIDWNAEIHIKRLVAHFEAAIQSFNTATRRDKR